MSRLLFTTWVFNNSISRKLESGRETGRVEFIVDGITLGVVDLDHKREFELPDGAYRVQCVLRYTDEYGDRYTYSSDIYSVELLDYEEFVFVLYFLPLDGSNRGFDCGIRGAVPLRQQAHEEAEGSSLGLCVISFIYFPIGLIYWLTMRKKKPSKAKKALKAALAAMVIAFGIPLLCMLLFGLGLLS